MTLLHRAADFVIGDPSAPYLRRWWLIPRNRWLNVYLHHFCRSDDDRALHDHPWWWCSVILTNPGYREITPRGAYWRKPWRPRFGRATALHRVALFQRTNADGADLAEIPVWTLFMTGPRIRDWGFACPQGWRHWRDFVSVRPGGNDTGRGCGA